MRECVLTLFKWFQTLCLLSLSASHWCTSGKRAHAGRREGVTHSHPLHPQTHTLCQLGLCSPWEGFLRASHVQSSCSATVKGHPLEKAKIQRHSNMFINAFILLQVHPAESFPHSQTWYSLTARCWTKRKAFWVPASVVPAAEVY